MIHFQPSRENPALSASISYAESTLGLWTRSPTQSQHLGYDSATGYRSTFPRTLELAVSDASNMTLFVSANEKAVMQVSHTYIGIHNVMIGS